MKLMPASRARLTIAFTSFWSPLPNELNIIAPSANGDTRIPVRPSGR
jgi:hypothetical protein